MAALSDATDPDKWPPMSPDVRLKLRDVNSACCEFMTAWADDTQALREAAANMREK